MVLDTLIDALPKRIVPDTVVKKRYLRSGLAFYALEQTLEAGNAALDAQEYRDALACFARWEREYASRGYATESLSTLALWRDRDLTDVLGRRCFSGEKPYLHARTYFSNVTSLEIKNTSDN